MQGKLNKNLLVASRKQVYENLEKEWGPADETQLSTKKRR